MISTRRAALAALTTVALAAPLTAFGASADAGTGMADFAATTDDPELVLRTLHDTILAQIAAPGFRGCPFINAAAEFSEPGHAVRRAVEKHRDWYVGVLEQLLHGMGHPLAGDAADDLMLARDGAMSGGYAGDPIAATAALTRTFDRIISEARVPVAS